MFLGLFTAGLVRAFNLLIYMLGLFMKVTWFLFEKGCARGPWGSLWTVLGTDYASLLENIGPDVSEWMHCILLGCSLTSPEEEDRKGARQWVAVGAQRMAERDGETECSWLLLLLSSWLLSLGHKISGDQGLAFVG